MVDAYQNYQLLAPHLGGLPSIPLTKEDKDALVHAFEVPTAPMTDLRAKLTTPLLGARCASCGLSETSELDHYLPKEHYPEFSILSSNLVPCCSNCNRRKSEKLLVEGTPNRRFLHLYYDTIPSQRFLQASLDLYADFIIVRFDVTRPRGVKRGLFQLLKSHVMELELVRRYQKMALLHMSDSRGSYRRLYDTDGTGQALTEELNRLADDLASDYGQNYWLSVLHSALADDENFCSGGFSALDASG